MSREVVGLLILVGWLLLFAAAVWWLPLDGKRRSRGRSDQYPKGRV